MRAFAIVASVLMLVVPAQAGAQTGARATQGPPAPLPVEPSSRLLFGPTARTPEPGHGYFAAYGPFLPFVQVGITRRFSAGIGMPLFSFGAEDPLFWITPKLQIRRTDRHHLAVGTLAIIDPGRGAIGLAHVISTHERGAQAFTVGAGWAYSSEKGDLRWAGGAPAVLLAYERRVSPRLTFITENYVVWGAAMLNAGLRVQRGRLSADIGALFFAFDGESIGGPFINVAWRF